MNPFYFGSSERPLYGVYTPPRARSRVQSGVVLCAPFGMEYMRSHRAFRQLTSLLNREGHHVLRFDYFGTGDSAGDGEDASVEQWTRDVETAIDELRDTASLDRVSLVGLRFGGLLAGRMAGERNDLNRVILWDPIVRGGDYVQEMLSSEGLKRPADGGRAAAEGTVGIAGFPLTEGLRAEMAELDLTTVDVSGARELLLVVSGERPEYLALRDAWKAAGVSGRYRLVPSAGNWAEGDKFGSALIPQAIIQDVVSCLS